MPNTAFSLASLDAYRHIEPDWIIPHFLPRGNIGFLLGAPKKAHKSWLLLNLAWDLSEGAPLWGITRQNKINHHIREYIHPIPRPMRVLYFCQEDTVNDIHARCHLIVNASGRALNDNLWFVPSDLDYRLDSSEGFRGIKEQIRAVARDIDGQKQLDLVIFDPMRQMHVGDENDSAVITALWGKLRNIIHTFDCSILFAHHLVKARGGPWGTDDTDPMAARGSSAIFGGGDAFINITPESTRDDGIPRLKLTYTLKRDAPLTPVELVIESGCVKFIRLLHASG